MGTIPTTPNFAAGEKLTAAKLNQVCDAIDFWALTPRCSVYQTATTNFATSGTAAVVAFDTELFDIVQSGDTASHDNTTDPSRVYIRTTGKYEISGQLVFATNATGVRTAQIRLNAAGASGAGTQLIQTNQGAVTGVPSFVPIAPFEASLSAGDHIEMFGTQTSGGALASSAGSNNTFLRVKLSGS